MKETKQLYGLWRLTVMLEFALYFIIGVWCGIFLMCLFQINRPTLATEYELSEEGRTTQEGGFDAKKQ